MTLDLDIQKLSPWIDNLPFQWDSIKHQGKTIFLKKGEHLFHEGDKLKSIFIVETGRVRLYLITMDGKEKTISIIGKNGLLGEYFLTSNQSHITNAIAVSDCKIIEIGKNTFENIVLENKELTKQWLGMLSKKLEILTHSLLHQTFESSLNRVIHAFIQLAETYGVKADNDIIKISITFTHQELAELIGTTRVTVSNSIKSLYEANLIFKKGRHYYIPDLNRLKNSFR